MSFHFIRADRKKRMRFHFCSVCWAIFNWHLTLLSAIAKLFLAHLAKDDEIKIHSEIFCAMRQLNETGIELVLLSRN